MKEAVLEITLSAVNHGNSRIHLITRYWAFLAMVFFLCRCGVKGPPVPPKELLPDELGLGITPNTPHRPLKSKKLKSTSPSAPTSTSTNTQKEPSSP